MVRPSQLAVADHTENCHPSDGRLDDRDAPDAMKGGAGIGENFRLGIRVKTVLETASPSHRGLVLLALHWRTSGSPSRQRQEPFVPASSSESPLTVSSGSGIPRWNAHVHLPDVTNDSPKEYQIPFPPQRRNHRETPHGRVSPPDSRSR